MSYYLARAKVSQGTMDALVKRPEDRFVTMTRLLKGVGGRLHYYFFCFGNYDIVLLFELPDDVTAAALSMVLTSSGSVTDIETTPLLTMEQAIAAMRKAGDATGVYAPPGRTAKSARKKSRAQRTGS